MIDWNKTQKLFGTTPDLIGYRPKVWHICDICHKNESPITIRIKKDIDKPWKCHSCIGKENSDILSASTKKSWKNQEYLDKMKKLKEKQKIDPNFNKAIKNKARKNRKKEHAWLNEVNIEKASIKSKNILSNPEIKEKQKIGLKKATPRINQNNNRSYLEKVLMQIFNDHNIKYIHQYVHGPWSFDFLVEDSTLIEVQGEYWHGLEKQIIKDKQKVSYVKNNLKYKLETIKEHEFLSPENILKKIKKIKPIIPTDLNIKDLQINQISRQKAALFLKQYHYLGSENRAGYYAGLFFNDKLIGVSGFGSVIRNQILKKHPNTIELIRFCLSPFYKNKNMGSWFLSRTMKMAYKNFNNAKFITYADTTVGHTGALYKATNWIFDGIVDATYWYIDNDGNRYHKKTIWDQAKKMSIKENEYAVKYNLLKIKDKQKKRFIYSI